MSAVLKDEVLPMSAADVALEWLASHKRFGCVVEVVRQPKADRAEVYYRRENHEWKVIGRNKQGIQVVNVSTGERVQGLVELTLGANGWKVERVLHVMPACVIGAQLSELAYASTSGVKTWERLVLKSQPFPERPKPISILPEPEAHSPWD